MATPNIINVDTITPVTNIVTLANTNATGIIDVPAEYVAKVNSLIVCNDDGSNAATITAEIISLLQVLYQYLLIHR